MGDAPVRIDTGRDVEDDVVRLAGRENQWPGKRPNRIGHAFPESLGGSTLRLTEGDIVRATRSKHEAHCVARGDDGLVGREPTTLHSDGVSPVRSGSGN